MDGAESHRAKAGGRTSDASRGPATEAGVLESVRLLADFSDDILWVMDPRSVSVVYVSSAYERLWKRSIPDLLANPCDFHAWVEPEDRERARVAIEALVRDGVPLDVTYQIRDGEGHPRWAHDRAWPVRDQGKVVRIIGILRDITKEKVFEEHQRLLLREMNHRVKNTLATVISIAHQTAANAKSLDTFLEGFYARVHAFSGAHDLLMQNAWTSIPLHDVISRTLAHHMDRDPGRVVIAGPTVLLPHDPSVALNLVFHELATNAAKYGALSTPEGRVSVTWSVEMDGPAGVLNLRWEESGGPPVRPNAHRGFGSRLIKRTLAALGGQAEVNFAPAGIDCWIALPLAPMAEAA